MIGCRCRGIGCPNCITPAEFLDRSEALIEDLWVETIWPQMGFWERVEWVCLALVFGVNSDDYAADLAYQDGDEC